MYRLFLSGLLLAAIVGAAAGVGALAGSTTVIARHVTSEDDLHKSSNGVHFYDGGYADDGDFLLLGELPRETYVDGGVYFLGSSETRASIMPWILPDAEQQLINNYAVGDLRHREVDSFLRMLVEERGLLHAGANKTTIVLPLYYPLARQKDLSVSIDRYVELLFERHRLYTYDWVDGIHDARPSSVERWLRVQRDRANRFLQILVTNPSRVRPFRPSEQWMRDHLIEVMGENWEAVMDDELAHLGRTLDYLDEKAVRVVLLYPPTGSWHDALPYDAAYREKLSRLTAERGLPAADFSDFLSDDEFGDDMHARYSGQLRLHEAYRQLALDQLDIMGTRPAS